MSNLILPRSVRQAQMSKPVVFWVSKKLDHIMCPPSPTAPAPTFYERVECRHAADVDIWSRRLRRQEKRIKEMTELERFEYEGKIQSAIIEEMEKNLRASTDPVNRQFMAWFIEKAKAKREKRRIEIGESYMECESREGVAS